MNEKNSIGFPNDDPLDNSNGTEEGTLNIKEPVIEGTSAVYSTPQVNRKKLDIGIKNIRLGKVLLFITSLYLFILAITLMKDGAISLAPLIQDFFSVSNPANGLGFGWLSSYFIMSGSPVAAAALTFFDAGIVDSITTYAMITGSRLGASFIVLVIGFLYVLRGRDRASSLSMGLLALTVTITTYVPSFFIGSALISSGVLGGVQRNPGTVTKAFTDLVISPITNLFSSFFPDWFVFIIGLGIILLSFNLFDKCLPQMSLKESQLGHVSRVVYHPIVMFTVGAAVTMISMSVSLSLSILVPLSNRGFIRRENVIPYILGANITTFIDTLFAASLLQNPSAFNIVLASMLSITIVSIILIFTFFRLYQRKILSFVDLITSNNQNMAIFMIVIFVIPLFLILFF